MISYYHPQQFATDMLEEGKHLVDQQILTMKGLSFIMTLLWMKSKGEVATQAMDYELQQCGGPTGWAWKSANSMT